jgi:hypothetical protein
MTQAAVEHLSSKHEAQFKPPLPHGGEEKKNRKELETTNVEVRLT